MPGRVEKTVFISYRRTNGIWARAIYQDLTARGYDAFYDFQSINSGDFSQIIVENIKGRAHFLVLLTPSALERCEDPNDWLRREIEIAIDNKRNIVPIILESFDFGSQEAQKVLVGKLALLKNYNGLKVYSEYFEEGMERLRTRYLNIGLEEVVHPISGAVEKATKEQQKQAKKASIVKKKELTSQEWFEKGYKSTHQDEKIHFYTEAIRLKPDFAYAFNNRGASHHLKGNLDTAIRDYNEAIRLESSFAEPYLNRGLARSNKEDLLGAIKDYSEAIRLKPDYAEAYMSRGNARSAKGDQTGAIKDYSEAIRLKPDDADAYFNRGGEWEDKNELSKAIADFQKYLDLGGGFATVTKKK